MEKILLEAIEKDKILKGNYARYSSRFMFLPLEKNTYSSIISICNKKSIRVCNLIECIKSKTSVITPSILIGFIEKNIRNDIDTLFIGLSEIIRLFDDAEFDSIIRTIIEIENPKLNSKRDYFLMFSCAEKLSFLVRKYKEKNYYPILDLGENVSHYKRISIYFHNIKDNESKSDLSSTSDYYDLFKNVYNGRVKGEKILCYSPKIVAYLKTKTIIDDALFTINQFSTPKDICKYYLKDFDLKNNYNFKDSDYDNILKMIDFKNSTILDLVIKYFGNVEEYNILNNFFNSDSSKRILLLMYILNCDLASYKFIQSIYPSFNSLEINDIIKAIFESIKNKSIYDSPDDLLSIRTKIIKFLIDKKLINYSNYQYDDLIEKSIFESYNYLVNFIFFNNEVDTFDGIINTDLSNNERLILSKNANKYIIPSLTSYSKTERKFIIWLLANSE